LSLPLTTFQFPFKLSSVSFIECLSWLGFTEIIFASRVPVDLAPRKALFATGLVVRPFFAGQIRRASCEVVHRVSCKKFHSREPIFFIERELDPFTEALGRNPRIGMTPANLSLRAFRPHQTRKAIL
jgi:hypothetical protein